MDTAGYPLLCPKLSATSNDLQNHKAAEDFHLNKPLVLSKSPMLLIRDEIFF